jgi:glycerol-3-phosphate dehydrogenase
MTQPLPLDAIIFGGGAAGLWLLDDLVRAGYSTLLLEANDLGSGQTIASQGLIHGGLKYTLGGLFTPAAKAIAEMPLIWRRSLAGEGTPDLTGTRLRAEYCHLWRTASLRSRLAMIGARAGLKVAPVKLAADERPAVLKECRGLVARLDEQVIDLASFVSDLSRQHVKRVVKIDAGSGLEIDTDGAGRVQTIRLLNPETGDPLDIAPKIVILTAGAGNASLRRLAGLKDDAMQRRPLHMVMVRADGLPVLNAHCVDGMATRITITTARDFADRNIWQMGGQIAERGVNMEADALIQFARKELRSVLPHLRLKNAEWATYRVDRAEAATSRGARPDDVFASREGNVITGWPTKLALVPELARRIKSLIADSVAPTDGASVEQAVLRWPRPLVALPPWETQQSWHIGD